MRSALARGLNHGRKLLPSWCVPLLVLVRSLLARRRPAVWADAQGQMRFVVGDDQPAEVVDRLAAAYIRRSIWRGESRWHPELITRQRVVGVEQLHALKDAGTGCVITFAHHGDYEGIAPSLAAAGIPCRTLVTSEAFEPGAPIWMQQQARVIDSEDEVTVLDVVEGAAAVREALSGGEVMALATDQPGHTRVRFLGHELSLSSGAVRVAVEMGAPVVVVTAHPDPEHPDRCGLFRVAEPLDPRRFDSAEALLGAVFQRLESAYLAWPEAAEHPLRMTDEELVLPSARVRRSQGDVSVESAAMPTVHSFDVFDTVLTRQVGDPDAVIDVLSKALESQGALPARAAVFAAARKRFETQLTGTLGRHATLREIHGEVAAALSADEASGEAWAVAEEDLERVLTVPVPGALERIVAARAAGRVVFVSDTPHSEAFLTSLLAQHGLAHAGDAVFTSSERGVSKSHGGLFQAVSQELGTDPDLHVGDNARSDVAAARVEGWPGALAPGGRLTRYERLLEQSSTATDGVTSWLAGSSRLARLEATQRGVKAPQAEVGSGVLAPLLVGFALWVVAQARQRGVRRLYYVARDGEVMLAVAKHVIGHLAPDLELRYLYGSRKPWIFGATATSDELLEDWVMAKPDYTARTLLARVDLTAEQVFEIARLESCRGESADRALTPPERVELAEALRSEPLLSMVRERGAAAAEQTLRYLRQEGLMDGTPSALVDAGWGGRTAQAFDHLLRQEDASQVEHFLVGIRGSREDLQRRGSTHLVPWLFDEQRHPASTARLPSSHTLIEVLCAGTVGRTLGYEVVGEESRPVLAAPVNEPVVAWGLPEVHAAAVRAAELVSPHLPPEAVHVDTSDAVFDVLSAFWVHPTKAEAEVWGEFPWEEEIWPPYAPLAHRLTTTGIIRQLLQGDGRVRRVNSWRPASAMASSQPWRGLLQARGWYVDNRARLRRIPRRLRLEAAARRRG